MSESDGGPSGCCVGRRRSTRWAPVDREILYLRHFEELTHAEAARVLEVEEGAAAKRYVRALKRLRDVLSAP